MSTNYYLQIDSFVLDEQETGELSEDDSRLGDEDDLEEDSEESEDDEVCLHFICSFVLIFNFTKKLFQDELEEEDEVDLHLQHDQRFLLRKDSNSESVAGAISGAIPVGAASALETEEIFPPVDPETQAKLEALFETAGIGKLAGETKQFTDPEVRIFYIYFFFQKRQLRLIFLPRLTSYIVLEKSHLQKVKQLLTLPYLAKFQISRFTKIHTIVFIPTT